MNKQENEKIKSKVSKKEGKHQKAYYINPDIFEWGREHANLSIEEASNKLAIPKKLLKQIEKSTVDLTMNDLRKIGNLYNLSTAAFYLEEVPQEKKTIEMSLDLRRDYRVKEIAMHLKLNTFGSLCLKYINENLNISESYVLADDIDEIERIRDFLNKIIEEKRSEKQWDCEFKSQGITLSQIIEDARQEGIEIGIENGRENLLAYLHTEINNFLENNKTLEQFKNFLNETIEHEKEDEQ